MRTSLHEDISVQKGYSSLCFLSYSFPSFFLDSSLFPSLCPSLYIMRIYHQGSLSLSKRVFIGPWHTNLNFLNLQNNLKLIYQVDSILLMASCYGSLSTMTYFMCCWREIHQHCYLSTSMTLVWNLGHTTL